MPRFTVSLKRKHITELLTICQTQKEVEDFINNYVEEYKNTLDLSSGQSLFINKHTGSIFRDSDINQETYDVYVKTPVKQGWLWIQVIDDLDFKLKFLVGELCEENSEESNCTYNNVVSELEHRFQQTNSGLKPTPPPLPNPISQDLFLQEIRETLRNRFNVVDFP